MIGVFDSGVGGLTAIKELRRLLPKTDIYFFADRKNAPYGTKSLNEVLNLARADIKILKAFGVQKILIACCTASAVYPLFDEDEKKLCVPLIEPAAKRALDITKNGRIGVIATERTVKEKAFSKSISSLSGSAEVFETPTQSFVDLIESGARDGRLTDHERLKIASELMPLRDKSIDTLILGCTHFPHIEAEIQNLLGVATVNPALEGALEIAKLAPISENGRTVYL